MPDTILWYQGVDGRKQLPVCDASDRGWRMTSMLAKVFAADRL